MNFIYSLNKGFCEFIDKFLINQLNVITENQIYNLIDISELKDDFLYMIFKYIK
jgi:hypothetical protein